jgi:signal transduction histidine kinase
MGAEHGIVWDEQGVDVPIQALASSDELKEVLLNVLENARHAHATHVTASVAPQQLDGGRPTAVIRVSDNGHGIPADVLPRIFEPHFSTRTSGSGLGLAISRQLVEGWGGEISVESEEGKGTTVEIRLAGA